MTIKQTRSVDWLGLEKETGHIGLTVIDDLDWIDEQGHLLLLQDKLNTYLAFIESGEVFDRIADKLGRQVPTSTPIKVSILAKYDVTSRAQEFLKHAAGVFKNAGFTLTHRVVKAP